jgi:hypothetical protein
MRKSKHPLAQIIRMFRTTNAVARRVYLLIHTPTEMGRPVQMGFVYPDAWSNKLFEKYKGEVEENRKKGGSVTHLWKKDIERWGFFPPVGPRVQVLEVEIPKEEWFEMWDPKETNASEGELR